MFVGLSAFYRPHDICSLCGAASEWPREQEPLLAAPRACGQAHAQPEHARAHAVQLLNEKIAALMLISTRAHAVQLLNEKIAVLMPFKNKTVRARAYCRIRNCRDFQKKGKRKPTCHFPSSVYSLPSLGVFIFRIVLNRT